MTKYTINKAFEKTLPSNIWKIEIDSNQPLLAVETRELDGSQTKFHVFDFQGQCIMQSYQAEDKEWTLDTIQDGYLILKRIGTHHPIQEGIQIINCQQNQVVFSSYEYVLLDVYCGYILARHRSIASGKTVAIHIQSGKLSTLQTEQLEICPNKIQYPITYPNLPAFLKPEQPEGPIWLSKCGQGYLWCYHQKTPAGFDLILTVSDLNRLLDRQVILHNMGKMIPQPYFQMERQVFFMSFNKQEIVSYLV